MEFAKILKANPYHDEKGRFSTRDKAKNVVELYHGTSSAHLDSIMKDGLVVKPENRTHAGLKFYYKGERGESVYLTKKKETADYYAEESSKLSAGSKMVILKIVVPKKDYEKFKPDEYEADSYRSLRKIPPGWMGSVVSKAEGAVTMFMCVVFQSGTRKKSAFTY